MNLSHTAEIIAVGTELLLGNIANTNAQEISQALSAVGINVFRHTVVGDNPERLRQAVSEARQRADILITTGGLGPTYDDLTKQTVCNVFGRNLIFHPDILADIRQKYERNLHTPMPSNNARQAELPEDCVIFANPVGTAPGCAFENDGVHVIMLPGPPFEMRTMLNNYVLPYLRKLSRDVIVSHDIMTFGMGESALEELLREQMEHMLNPTLATYAKPSEVRLRATAKAQSPQLAEQLLAPVVQNVTQRLGNIVYGVDVPDLEHVCAELLRKRGWTLATAESCTGGRLAQRLTAIAGISDVYRGGVVSYWTAVKQRVLGVPADVLEPYGAVSEQTAKHMAQGARNMTGAETALSVTGVAGPSPDERGVRVGIVFIGLATPEGTFCRALDLGNRRRDLIQNLASNHAFDLLRRYLSGLPLNEDISSGLPLNEEEPH